MKRIIIVIVLFSACFTAKAQETVNTLSLNDAESPNASIEQVAWMQGTWKGPAFSGWGEESWSAPAGGAMMGMYRSMRADTVWFYELFSIREEDESLVLNLKHFHPDLRGWEEKDKVLRFPLVKIEDDAVWFNGLTYKKIDDDHMTIYLRMKRGDERTEEVFRMERVK